MDKVSKFIGIVIFTSVCQTLICYCCLSGFYGQRCEKDCPHDCVSCTQGSENSGLPCTSCVPGQYSGREYDHSYRTFYDDCSLNCRYVCASCTGWNNCTECIDGRYGTACQFDCYRGCEGGQCDQLDGKCTCTAGYASRFCQSTCTNYPCRCCKNNKCDTNNSNYCTDGCIDGYRGNTCSNECPANCETCTQGSVDNGRPCTACIRGKYSGRANDYESNPYYDDCRHDCSYECVSCASYHNCTECEDGRYGTKCRYGCYRGCEGGRCDNVDGKCTCKTGYASRLCKGQPTCTNTPCACCKNNNCETNNDNYCTDGCIDGIWGKTCGNECPKYCATCTQDSEDSGRPCTACIPGKYSGRSADYGGYPYHDDCRYDCMYKCVSCTSWYNCTECVDGSYGKDCQYSCYEGCEGRRCGKLDGKCTCKTGYASRFCKRQPSCKNSTCACCKYNTCDTNNNNYCTHGCIDGVKGDACDNECPTNCEACSSSASGRPCTSCVPGKYSGRREDNSRYPYVDDCRQDCRDICVSCASYDNCTECVDGLYGTKCQHGCYSGCEGGQCDIDGKCTCTTGYASIFCKGQPSCTNNPCTCCKNNKCETNNGTYCTDGCVAGFWGITCDKECPSDCLKCTQGSTESGRPCVACVSGKHNGRRWDHSARPYYDDCRHNCNPVCASCTGWNNCTECIDGRYGPDCQYECYRGCEGGQCHKMDGQCSCKTGYASRFCKDQQSCTNNPCTCCRNSKCETDNSNYCTDGCIHGVRGDTCNNECPANCATCTLDAVERLSCTSCVHGKYIGREFDDNYPYYDDCRNDCERRCVSCTSYENCTECVVGRYGIGCRDSCYRGCEGRVCDKIDGKCTCKTGYASRFCKGQPSCTNSPCACCKNHNCETNNGNICTDGCIDGMWGITCINKCPINCETCTQGSGRPCTVCASKKYSGEANDRLSLPQHDDCRHDCGNEKCLSCFNFWGDCTECLDGQYGRNCYSECSNGCEGGICSKMNGSCSCVNGFYGIRCDKHCEKGCEDGSCDKTNGNCSCKSGFTGVNCDRCAPNRYGLNCTFCPDKCVTCSSSISCETCLDGYYNGYNVGTGKTVYDCSNQCRTNCKSCSEYDVCSECKNVFWGHICANSCSNGCEGGTCNAKNGHCSCKTTLFKGDACDQCIAGRFGNECSKICLFQNCKHNECDKINGVCSSCKVGYYGNDECDKTCSSRCSSSVCDFNNGKCTHGCISGYSGDMCCVNNEKCLTCFSPSVCSKCQSGYAIITDCSECVPNKYGPNCGSDCGSNCLKNGEQSKCVGHNGTCVVGCQEGFYGDKCDLRCHQNCKEFTCSRFNGICSHGCQEGFIISGSNCAPAVPIDDGDFPVAALGIAIGGGVAVLLIIAGIVFLLVKRRNNRPQNNSVTTDNVTQGREDTRRVDDTIGSVDSDNRQPVVTGLTDGSDEYHRLRSVAGKIQPAVTSHIDGSDEYQTRASIVRNVPENDKLEVAVTADDSESYELDVLVHNDPDVMEDEEERTIDETIQHHYDTVEDEYESLNPTNEQGNYDELIDSQYEDIDISKL